MLEPPIFDIAGAGLVVSTGISVSQTVIIGPLAAPTTVCIIACVMLCSDAILSYFYNTALFQAIYFLPINILCVRLFTFAWHHVMLLPFKEGNPAGRF